MKRLQEYHIEHYWATEAAKRKKRAEFKEKLPEIIIIGAFTALETALTWEFLRQVLEVI